MMRLRAPELETEGWELFVDEHGEGLGVGKQVVGKKLGKSGQMLEEWTTGHPKVCPVTGDLIFFGYNMCVLSSLSCPKWECPLTYCSQPNSFAPPFVTHSVVRKDGSHSASFKAPVYGVQRPKMMHDFGVSLHHSIILDLPLTMNPLNIVLAQPMLHFNRSLMSRFGILPRHFDGTDPEQVRWFEDSEPCLIFHTADAWDEGLSGAQYTGSEDNDSIVAVNFFCCRFRTSKLVFAAGGMQAPAEEEKLSRDLSDVVRLTYMRFSISEQDPLRNDNPISHAFSLSAIPFDFPVVSHQHSMRQHRFIYGCTLRHGQFDSALEGAKIDCLVKIDAETLRCRGIELAQKGQLQRYEEVDKRTVGDVLAGQREGTSDPCIQVFDLPEGIHGQEPVFVPRSKPRSEDDGYLVFYVYDEAQLLPDGSAPDTSSSQMYIIDASKMGAADPSSAIVGIVQLPARVPYGLHSTFITAEQIESQLKPQEINRSTVQSVTRPMKSRSRSATVSFSERTDLLEVDLVQRAAKQTEITVWIWCASLFWLLLSRMGISSPAPSVCQVKQGLQARKRSISRPTLHRMSSQPI